MVDAIMAIGNSPEPDTSVAVRSRQSKGVAYA